MATRTRNASPRPLEGVRRMDGNDVAPPASLGLAFDHLQQARLREEEAVTSFVIETRGKKGLERHAVAAFPVYTRTCFHKEEECKVLERRRGLGV